MYTARAHIIGHNLSQIDANSMGGESGRHVGTTGTGCYKNHEHMLQHSVPLSARDRRRQSSTVPAAAANLLSDIGSPFS